MVAMPRARRVKISIRSSEISPAAISSTLDADPDVQWVVGEIPSSSVLGRPARENVWELMEAGDDDADINALIAKLMARVEPMVEKIASLRSRGCSISLDVVQHISHADRTGPGFYVDHATLKFLAEVGAELDVDQYVEE